MPYKDKAKQSKYTTAYNLVHKQQATRTRGKSSLKIYIRDYADDIDLEELQDMIRERKNNAH